MPYPTNNNNGPVSGFRLSVCPFASLSSRQFRSSEVPQFLSAPAPELGLTTPSACLSSRLMANLYSSLAHQR